MSINSFAATQERMLARYGVEAVSRFIEVPVIEGRAQVLATGEGPPVVMVGGIGTPAAMWAPLMAQLAGFRLHAVDLPGFGLTDSRYDLTRQYRATAVRFLCETLDQLDLDRAMFVASSLGSTWVIWLSLDAPDRVAAAIHVGCPATALGTSAPLPMRLLSVPHLGRLLMRLQPPSPMKVEQLSRMVHQYPLVPELADLLVATERLPHFEHTFLDTLRTSPRFVRRCAATAALLK
jgi:pimeloyl-ACP methyl ester carboxylesterase